eukprot:1568945-Amphidinium_carterae.1
MTEYTSMTLVRKRLMFNLRCDHSNPSCLATELIRRARLLVSCTQTMSRIGQGFRLNSKEASLLWHCASFWPDSMVDKSSFMKMLTHVLNVEAQSD